MESMYLGLETFKELEEVLEHTRETMKMYPGDFALEISYESLEQFKKSALLELKRRARDESDLEAYKMLELLEG